MGPVSWILLSPFLGALGLLFIPSAQIRWIRRISAAATGLPLLIALGLLGSYDRTLAGFQWVDKIPWIPSLGISYQVGADGINLALLLLHALCSFTGVLISYRIQQRVKEYYLFYLLLIGGVYGVFTSLDLFFFYFFYEMAVIPMFPLIGIWGSGDKVYATMKLTLYLTAGAVLALLGILSIYVLNTGHGVRSFDLVFLSRYLAQNPIPSSLQHFLFPFLLIGFGVIAPIWPLHSWSPIGHAAAPSAVSMLHAGVLMKLGSYAILRVAIPLLPEGAFTWLPWVAGISIMNILYGGFVAMAQKDIKFLIGYSYSSHMGYVLLGIACLNQVGLNGAVLLMFAHGLMTALAFASVGHLYDQTHTRQVAEWGGLARQVPFIATSFTIAALAASGLPGFANFVSELLVFFGSWESYRWSSLAAVFGIVVTAFTMLRAVRTGFFGGLNPRWNKLQDATPFERLPYLILVGSLLIVGCWPRLLTDVISLSTGSILQALSPLQTVAKNSIGGFGS
ncbi:MAG: NADH-quinone oxidoreductase subunit M [Candidatus Omnitrophica bacterium]|nr:NADH-quinone oxidoreductase subunit M [Candidatus Omnitrophota bacterium]